MKNPIVKLAKANVDLSNGVKFKVVHDLSDKDFDFCLQRWANTTRDFSDENFCRFAHQFFPKCICVTEKQYQETIEGKSVPATEQEYLNQQKGK